MLGYMTLDEDQVVKRNLQCGVASLGAAQRLFDEDTERQDATTRGVLGPARRNREGPDHLDHLSGRVFEKGTISIKNKSRRNDKETHRQAGQRS